MPSIRIRNVPDDVDRTLRRRAAAAGLSLDAYLLRQLTEEARTPTADDIRDRTGRPAPAEFSVEHLTVRDGVPPAS
ncbi:antitoxin [Streptomyces sp. PA03-6a]|nr:antitoxin [Streptomyces sp. PA03-6a]